MLLPFFYNVAWTYRLSWIILYFMKNQWNWPAFWSFSVISLAFSNFSHHETDIPPTFTIWDTSMEQSQMWTQKSWKRSWFFFQYSCQETEGESDAISPCISLPMQVLDRLISLNHATCSLCCSSLIQMDFRKPLLYCLNFTNYFVKTLLPPLQALAEYHRASHRRKGRTHCHNLQVKETSCASLFFLRHKILRGAR